MDRLVFLLVLSCIASVAWGYGEEDATGRPQWQDRANQVFVNAVRLAPLTYKSLYMSGWNTSNVFATSTYSAQPPLYYSVQLDDSAYNHSLDMDQTNTFSHSSSDGTDPFTRIGYFYTCGGYEGENIAAGYADPLMTNNQWLCDGSTSSCAPDGNGDGHRSNIMLTNYKAIGVGYAYRSGSTYGSYWTQDFGGGVCSPSVTSPIYGGSHYFPSSGTTKFLATYYTSPASAPASAQVNIDGTSYTLTYELGMAQGQGQYVFSQTSGSACRNYYFVFQTSSGVSYRYPETGYLVTYKEGSCVTSFTAGSSGTTSAPTTAAPTTSAPTTSAPTTSAPTTSTPTTSTPTTSAPTTSAPTTSTPTTSAPTTSAPTTTTPPRTTTTYRPWSTTPRATTTTTTAPTSSAAPTTVKATTTTARPTTTSSPGTTTTSSGSGMSSDFTTNHNAARSAVKENGLVWNSTIATFATNYAKTCNFAHNSNRGSYGENIYASSGTVPSDIGVKATASWVGEKQYFTCSTNTCASGQTCGHYTQVIWSSTTQFGCGAVTCTTNSPFGSSFPTWTMVVCDYNPAGNYVGQAPCPSSSC